MRYFITILTIIILYLLTGCFAKEKKDSENKRSQTYIEREEIKIINLTFLELIGTDWYYEQPQIPPPPLGSNSTKEDSIRYQNEFEKNIKENENRILDTSRLVVIFNDTLIVYFQPERLIRILKPESFLVNFSVDTSYISILRKLITQNVTRPINLLDITNRGKYELVAPSDESLLNGKFRKIGRVRYSRVEFNEQMDKACFYFDFYYGPRWAYGEIVFMEKQNGIWTIIGHREMWIS